MVADWSNGKASISVPVIADGVAEAPETLTFSLHTAQSEVLSVSGSINDTSGPTPGPTFDTTSPIVQGYPPSNDATGVAVDNNITLTFSEAIQKGTGTIQIRAASTSVTVVEIFDAASSNCLTVSGSTLTIDPTVNLGNRTQYFVVLPSGSVKDLAGNNFSGTSTYDFTTVAAPLAVREFVITAVPNPNGSLTSAHPNLMHPEQFGIVGV